MIVQKLRLQHGWSQEQLADMCELSTRTIQRIERGQPASPESLKALGAIFNVDFNELKENNMPAIDTSNEEKLAFIHVRKLRGFYIHAMKYCIAIPLLIAVNYFFAPRYPWVLWVMFGWGIGLLSHGLAVFNKVPFLNVEWEKREVEKYLGRKL